MSQAERQEKRARAAAEQAAEMWRWRHALGLKPMAAYVASCFPPAPVANRPWAAHWVIGASRQMPGYRMRPA